MWAKNVSVIFSSNCWKNCIFLDIFEKVVKVVLDFGKQHANWSNINGVMIGWSWKVMFGKVEMGVFALKSCIVTKKIMDFSKLDFST